MTVPSLGTALVRMQCNAIATKDKSPWDPLTFEFLVNIVVLEIPILMGLDVLSDIYATVDVSEGKLRTPTWNADI
jgi:hypothetical protein